MLASSLLAVRWKRAGRELCHPVWPGVPLSLERPARPTEVLWRGPRRALTLLGSIDYGPSLVQRLVSRLDERYVPGAAVCGSRADSHAPPQCDDHEQMPSKTPRTPRQRRARLILLLAVAGLLLLGAALLLQRRTPPRCARLLPESQAIVYFDLRPLRAATHFDQRPVAHDPAYQRFIEATGINFERDLDEAAFALHRTADPLGPNGPVAYSEVFAGRFDADRLTRYLAGVAAAEESYAGGTIYAMPSAGRTVRVALLGSRLVAISNAPTAEQIHSILDRDRSSLLPFGGSSLLLNHYKEVPLLSLAWGIGEIGLPFADHGRLSLMGLVLPMRLDTTFIASLRWTGSLRLRLEQIALSERAAAAAAGTLQSLIHVGQVAENNLPGSLVDENVRALLNSATVANFDNRAVVNATLPEHFFEKLMAAPRP